MKPCNGLLGEILKSPALDAFKSRKTATRKDKDVADATTTDNLLSSFQVVSKYYSEEEEKSIFQVVPHSSPFPPVSLFIPNALKCAKSFLC